MTAGTAFSNGSSHSITVITTNEIFIVIAVSIALQLAFAANHILPVMHHDKGSLMHTFCISTVGRNAEASVQGLDFNLVIALCQSATETGHTTLIKSR